MGNVETYRPPSSVSFEGKALTVVGQLSKAAMLLAELVTDENLSEETRAKVQNVMTIMEGILDMMDAVETTLDRFEARAETILEVLTDGEEANFCNRGSERYFVSGVMTRRVQTIAIKLLGFAESVPAGYANLNVNNNNIIVLRGERKSAKVALRVAC